MQADESKERRSACNHLVQGMLDERRQLLSLLLDVSSVNADAPSAEDEELLEEFCQLLVDYIASGHFGLYERLAEGRERRTSAAKLASDIYPQIERSTELALAFTERYKAGNPTRFGPELTADLSRLGEFLSTRMELEDKLINALMS